MRRRPLSQSWYECRTTPYPRKSRYPTVLRIARPYRLCRHVRDKSRRRCHRLGKMLEVAGLGITGHHSAPLDLNQTWRIYDAVGFNKASPSDCILSTARTPDAPKQCNKHPGRLCSCRAILQVYAVYKLLMSSYTEPFRNCTHHQQCLCR